jgi:hypothetical protein
VRASWRVAEDTWLGLARPLPSRPGTAGSRFRLDRVASAMAEREAIAASGRRANELAVSRAHSCGVGTAIVSPARLRLGMDLVRVNRVTARHLAGILTGAESGALRRFGSLGPALAWGLKEAAAKASGDPRRWFPHGLWIEERPTGLVVRIAQDPSTCFGAGWVRFGGFLCVWVRELPQRVPTSPCHST